MQITVRTDGSKRMKRRLSTLQVRLENQDILLTAPLIGEDILVASDIENEIVNRHSVFDPLI